MTYADNTKSFGLVKSREDCNEHRRDRGRTTAAVKEKGNEHWNKYLEHSCASL